MIRLYTDIRYKILDYTVMIRLYTDIRYKILDYTVMIRIDTYRYHTVSICYDTFYNGVSSISISTYCICTLLTISIQYV